MMRNIEKVAVLEPLFLKKFVSNGNATQKSRSAVGVRPFARLVRPLSNYKLFMKKTFVFRLSLFFDDVKVQPDCIADG